MPTHTELANFIWSVADLLRGDYKQSEYGKVILPFTVLRRLDCVMARTRQAVWDKDATIKVENKDAILYGAAGLRFYNLSRQRFATIGGDADNVATNLNDYLNGFSASAREILEKYEFHAQIARLDAAGLLYKVVQKFAEIDLSPQRVNNHQMGYVFEELIRKFSEISNETAGEHFTPREVIELMVNLLLAPDGDTLTQPGKVINILDPACGTGGMLSAAEEHITSLNPNARVFLFGQELNGESYAICRSDMMVKDQDPSNIVFGNSFSADGHRRRTFDYLLSNPPFGVEWKKVQEDVEDEYEALGYAGRFGAGLPRINDGSFLFLQHMISKMKPVERDGSGGTQGLGKVARCPFRPTSWDGASALRPATSAGRVGPWAACDTSHAGQSATLTGPWGGTRLAIVFNGSPLFTGGAGSGESEIRRWILENDWLEAIVALPDQLFYNTGISTYFWIVTNRKDAAHKGKVVLLDAREYWAKMRKSLGEKRKLVTKEQIRRITELYGDALAAAADPDHPGHAKVKVFANEDFGYQRITVDRPLRQRFEVTEETLAALADAKSLAKHPDRDALLDAFKPQGLGKVARCPFRPTSWDGASALRRATSAGRVGPWAACDTSHSRQSATLTGPCFKPLLGAVWRTKKDAKSTLLATAAEAGVPWPAATTEKSIWGAVAISDPKGELQTKNGKPLPDPDLRDYENVPLTEDIDEYFTREVAPHVPEAWIADIKDPRTGATSRARIGYEIPLTRHFYVYKPPRPLAEIDAELRELEAQIQLLLGEVTG